MYVYHSHFGSNDHEAPFHILPAQQFYCQRCRTLRDHAAGTGALVRGGIEAHCLGVECAVHADRCENVQVARWAVLPWVMSKGALVFTMVGV